MSFPIKDLSLFDSPSCGRESHLEKLCLFLVFFFFSLIQLQATENVRMKPVECSGDQGLLGCVDYECGSENQQEDFSGCLRP